MNQTGGKHAVKGKQKPLLKPSLSKMGSIGKRGLSHRSPLSTNVKCFKHSLLCPSFVHKMEIQEESGERVSFKMEEYATSFPRILVAEFQIRTSYSRTCTEDRRQVGDRSK